MSCPNFDIIANCTDNGPIQFSADPDVAGIGVILAFLISAWATFLFVIITFAFVEAFDGAENELDKHFVKNTRKLKRLIQRLMQPFFSSFVKFNKPLSLETIQTIGLTMSDQQLLTGMSIYIVAFAKHCTITQYHFYIVYNLGLLSFATHQSTMMIVREKLRAKPWRRGWRLTGIFAVFVSTITTNIVVYEWNFFDELGFVMQCIWRDYPYQYGSTSAAAMVISSVVLVWGFGAVLQDLAPGNALERAIRHVFGFLGSFVFDISPKKWLPLVEKRLIGATRVSRSAWWVLYHATWAISLIYFTLVQIFSSTIVDLCRIWITLFLATLSLVQIRGQASQAQTYDGDPLMQGDESTWGFGQILPMLLLLMPISQVWEMVMEAIDDQENENKEITKNDGSDASSGITPSNLHIGSAVDKHKSKGHITISATAMPETTRRNVEQFYHLAYQKSEEGIEKGIQPIHHQQKGQMAKPIISMTPIDERLYESGWFWWYLSIWISFVLGGSMAAALNGFGAV